MSDNESTPPTAAPVVPPTPVTRVVPPGWYPNPANPSLGSYWNGKKWVAGEHAWDGQKWVSIGQLNRPAVNHPLGWGMVALAAVGLAMAALTNASLLTGTGTQWTGFAIAAVAAIVALVKVKTVPVAALVITVIIAALALVTVIYVEIQLEQKRQEISQIFGSVR